MPGPIGRPADSGGRKRASAPPSACLRCWPISMHGGRAREGNSVTDRVAVVGAGQMGNGIAHVFAQAGHPVTMIDVSSDALARGRGTIEKNLERQLKKGTIDAAQRDATLGRLSAAQELGAASGAALVVEAATEDMDLKFRIFRDLDAAADPSAILASNTSSISITDIARQTKRPELVVGMHFMNPVPVMKLVEIIRGLATSDATTERVVTLSRALGKKIGRASCRERMKSMVVVAS